MGAALLACHRRKNRARFVAPSGLGQSSGGLSVWLVYGPRHGIASVKSVQMVGRGHLLG